MFYNRFCIKKKNVTRPLLIHDNWFEGEGQEYEGGIYCNRIIRLPNVK